MVLQLDDADFALIDVVRPVVERFEIYEPGSPSVTIERGDYTCVISGDELVGVMLLASVRTALDAHRLEDV